MQAASRNSRRASKTKNCRDFDLRTPLLLKYFEASLLSLNQLTLPQPHRVTLLEPPMKNRLLPRLERTLCALVLLHLAPVVISQAQLAPGPYEILPFQDGFIIEAFVDLDTRSGPRADWTGWSGTSWISPNAYDNHEGTDISLQTGTPLYALAAGTIIAVETSYSAGDHSMGGHGNYVKIALDDPAPNGESLEVVFAHMLSVSATMGQRVEVGDQVGLSDNTGNSTSEHLHIQSEIGNEVARCPFYWGHYKYPILFNPQGTSQIGHVVRVAVPTTTIRTDRFDTSPQVTTAHLGQLYFASFAKRGYFQIFIPGNTTWRSAWVRASDVEEVFTGQVVQTMPDNVPYIHARPLISTYSIYADADENSDEIGNIRFGGGRFVADQIVDGFYRIPIPGEAATWGWVKADDRMIVYPELYNPAINPESIPYRNFPIRESFSTLGKSIFGRAKFTRAEVRDFTPASPDGDGKALFITDANNSGNGLTESVVVGRSGDRNSFVQSDVYLDYQPSYVNGANNRWERYGIFLRDDGFAGMSHSFEGAGNGYAFVFDSDDGRLRAGRLLDGSISDFQTTAINITTSGWHTLRIEAREDKIRYLLDGEELIEVTDTTFPAGQSGFGYYWNPNGTYPSQRGAYFDNFLADTLDPVPLSLKILEVAPDGEVQLQLQGDVGSTTRIESAESLTGPDNWHLHADVPNTSSVILLEDNAAGLSTRFYRATRKEDPEL